VELTDGWALVRASNTGARLTLRFEANDENRLREIQTMVLSHLANAEKGLGLRAPDSDPMST